jgi:DNA polymerase III subunit delta'
VAVVHPAEALNPHSASALLKTLEEPAAGTRLLLACGDPEQLLPTVRSRCQRLRLADPPPDDAAAWLLAQNVVEPRVLLAACCGRPLDVVTLVQCGIDAATWSALPARIARGRTDAVAGWPVPRALDALHKLCHDALAMSCGGRARYFPSASVPPGGSRDALLAWLGVLQQAARHQEHPWHDALLLEALVQTGARAWHPTQVPSGTNRLGLDTLPT